MTSNNIATLGATLSALIALGACNSDKTTQAPAAQLSELEAPIVDCQTQRAACLSKASTPQDAISCNDDMGKCLLDQTQQLAEVEQTVADCQNNARECALQGGPSGAEQCRTDLDACVTAAVDADGGVPTTAPAASGAAGAAGFPRLPGGAGGAPGLPRLPGGAGGAPGFPQLPAGVGGAPGFPQLPAGVGGASGFPQLPGGGNLPRPVGNLPQLPGAGFAGAGGPSFPGGGPAGGGLPRLPGGGLAGRRLAGIECLNAMRECVAMGSMPMDCAMQARSCLRDAESGAAGAAAP
jgi:hypothetical protein